MGIWDRILVIEAGRERLLYQRGLGVVGLGLFGCFNTSNDDHGDERRG